MSGQPTPIATTTPELDLDAWLDDIALPQDEITIYARADLVKRHEQLTLELQAARAADLRVDEEDRGIDHGAAADALDEQRAAVLEQMRGSGKTFRIHGVTQDTIDEVARRNTQKSTGKTDSEAYLVDCISVATDLSIEQVRKIKAHVPLSEWVRLSEAVKSIMTGAVSLPFS